MSEYVDRAVAFAIAEDLEDIEALDSRRNEPTESLDDFLAAIKSDGLIQNRDQQKGSQKRPPFYTYKRCAKNSYTHTKTRRNPFPIDATKLKGLEEWRIRQGLYMVEEEIVTVIVVKVGPRRDVYRG